ncbi:MAG: hypothetical protein R6V75_06185 [Bacteroidales bacterium]
MKKPFRSSKAVTIGLSLFIILLSVAAGCTRKGFQWETEQFRMKISATGTVTGIYQAGSGKNYLYEGHPAPLMQIRRESAFIQPVGASLEPGTGILLLEFPNATTARIAVGQQPTHLTFTLQEITGADSIDLVVWGPYPTTISETVGETVGVVRDSVFAIGIQALNLKTLGGFPTEESDIEPSYDIFETGSLIDVADSIKVFYRGQTARKEPFGSVLQAYCRNRDRERVIPNWGHERYVAPPFEDGGVTGSSIALFGSRADQALATIGEIELAEGLPHPMIGDEWAKTAREATAAYLIMNFGIREFEDALALTKKAGLKYLYQEGPFETWGHFKLNARQFPENWETMRLMVERAEEEGILLGIHTLSNFITTNDPYVTPVPDPRLAKVGATTLAQPLSATEKTIGIADPGFFNQMINNTLRAAVIGNEIIRYREVSEEAPWRLLGCERGAFGTKASVHAVGSVIAKLMDHPYQTFLSDNELSEEIALRIADFFNQTGCRQISFDGLEGNWSTGMGQYGRQRFTQIWYDHLQPELQGRVITDASNPGHYFWHMFTRMNWGEPWYAGFRESQTQYRLLNQLYFNRNLIPAMLGWFKMTPETSLEDVEWLLARSAGFDAGYALVTSLEAVSRNGFSNPILQAIKLWEQARMAGAFPEEAREQLQDIRNEFRLETDGPTNWNLYPYTIWRAELKTQSSQKGAREAASLEIENPNPDQPIRFVLSSGPDNAVSGIALIIDDRKIPVPLDLPANHHLRYDGGSYVHLYDRNWNLRDTTRLIQYEVTLTQGKHQVGFEATVNNTGAEKGVKIEMKTEGLPYSLSATSRLQIPNTR